MKTSVLWILAGMLSVGLGGQLHSQGAGAPRTALEQLQAIKAKNTALLDKQAATLKQLEALQKEAAQLKSFTKRG